jgi:metal-responsive CopG/Arc/MetJ family transcriptional regulator
MSATGNTTDRTVRLSVRVTADTADAVDQFIEQGLSTTRQDLLCRALHCYLYHEDEVYDPQTRIAGLIDHLFTTLQQRIEQQRRERRLYHLFQVTLNLATLYHQARISQASHRAQSPALADAIDPLDADYLFGYTTGETFDTVLDLSLRGSACLQAMTRHSRSSAERQSHE